MWSHIATDIVCKNASDKEHRGAESWTRQESHFEKGASVSQLESVVVGDEPC